MGVQIEPPRQHAVDMRVPQIKAAPRSGHRHIRRGRRHCAIHIELRSPAQLTTRQAREPRGIPHIRRQIDCGNLRFHIH